SNLFLAVRTLEIPTVAGSNGHAIGAGLCFALGCDLRIAAADAKMGMTFTKLGIHPGMGATYFPPPLIGTARGRPRRRARAGRRNRRRRPRRGADDETRALPRRGVVARRRARPRVDAASSAAHHVRR